VSANEPGQSLLDLPLAFRLKKEVLAMRNSKEKLLLKKPPRLNEAGARPTLANDDPPYGITSMRETPNPSSSVNPLRMGRSISGTALGRVCVSDRFTPP
jgi:hypothetical protein